MEIKNYLKGLDPYKAKLDQADRAKGKKGKGARESDSSANGDRISLSNEAKLRTEAYQSAMSASDVRQEKVDALKEKVAAGEYEVDSRQVAKKLLEDEKDFFI